MTCTAEYRLTCDHPDCLETMRSGWGEEPMHLRERARSLGWSVARQYQPAPDYCPTHAKENT